MGPKKQAYLNGIPGDGVWPFFLNSAIQDSLHCTDPCLKYILQFAQIHFAICTDPFCNFDSYMCLSCQSTECTGSPGQVGRAWCGWTATHKYSSSFHVIAGAQNASRSYCEQVMSMWDEQANKLTSQAAAKSS